MSKHSIRQQVNLTVIVSDNDLIIIETGAGTPEGGGSITINYEECSCLLTLLDTAWIELSKRKREDDGLVAPPADTGREPFPVKEIELS
jgi:hypothetical protein